MAGCAANEFAIADAQRRFAPNAEILIETFAFALAPNVECAVDAGRLHRAAYFDGFRFPDAECCKRILSQVRDLRERRRSGLRRDVRYCERTKKQR